MLDPRAEANLRTFETPEVARHYASLGYVTPCERLLFDCYIKPESDVLDLGVGVGRPRRIAYPLLDPGMGNRRTAQFSVSDRPHCGE
jgi:hypothetical protein